MLLSALQTQPGGFGRGLPVYSGGLSSPSCLNLLRELVSAGYFSVVDRDRVKDMPHDERVENAHEMRLNGYVYVSSTASEDPYEPVTMQVASPLHRAWFSSRLQRGKPLPPIASSLDTLWKQVLSGFSAAALGNPNRTPVSKRNASFVEAQYQEEFYRSLYSLTGGACCISPEYGGKTSFPKKGRIDFFISNMGWGIELLRDGDRIDGHVSRFQEGGAYHPWLASGDMKEYVILDCRKTIPSKPSSLCLLIPRCILTEIVCRCGSPFPCGLQ